LNPAGADSISPGESGRALQTEEHSAVWRDWNPRSAVQKRQSILEKVCSNKKIERMWIHPLREDGRPA
jgi:hypothetical protein